MTLVRRVIPLAVALIVCGSSFILADDQPAAPTPASNSEKKEEPKIIKPAEAKDNVGKTVTVEFTVAASRELADTGYCFLNSSSKVGADDNFTVFLNKAACDKLKADAKIEHPADYFKKKTVRVTGKIEMYKEKPEIKLDTPDQIKVIETDAEKKDADKPPADTKM